MIIAEEPPAKKKPGREFSPETREKIEWMKAHPGQWIVWHRKRQPPPRHVKSSIYERQFRTVDGVTTLYVRLRPLPEHFTD